MGGSRKATRKSGEKTKSCTRKSWLKYEDNSCRAQGCSSLQCPRTQWILIVWYPYGASESHYKSIISFHSRVLDKETEFSRCKKILAMQMAGHWCRIWYQSYKIMKTKPLAYNCNVCMFSTTSCWCLPSRNKCNRSVISYGKANPLENFAKINF